MAAPEIKARLVLETGGGGLAGAATGGGGSKGGLAGSLGFGKMAGAVATGMLALDAIKKLMGKLVQSSPRLQATLNIMSKSIGLLLRPIGDTIGLFLRPFAIAMLRFALPFYKAWAKSDFLKTAMKEGFGQAIKDLLFGKKEELEAPGGPFKDKPQPQLVLGILPAAAGESLGQKIIEIFGLIGGFFSETLPEAWDFVSEKMSTFFGETLPDVWESVSKSMGTFFGNTLPEVTETLWKRFIEFWSVTFPDIVKKLWELIKDFFLVKIPEWAKTAFNYLKDIFLVKIPAWVGEMADKARNLISSAISSVKSFFGLGEKKEEKKSRKVRDALITKTGQVIQIDPNDNLLAFKGNQGTVGTNNITVNVHISALDAHSISPSLIDKITTQLTENMKRQLQGRSSYGIGI